MKRFSTIVLMVGLFLTSAGFAVTPDTLDILDMSAEQLSWPKFSESSSLTEEEIIFIKLKGIAFYLLFSNEKETMSLVKVSEKVAKFLEISYISDERLERIFNELKKNSYISDGVKFDLSGIVAEGAVSFYRQDRYSKK